MGITILTIIDSKVDKAGVKSEFSVLNFQYTLAKLAIHFTVKTFQIQRLFNSRTEQWLQVKCICVGL